MKKTIRLMMCAAVMFTAHIMAQVPQKFNYQGVVRNSSGNPLANTTIGLQLSITDGVTTFYSETFTPTTSLLGLFNVEVGNGVVVSGVFNTIDWLSGPKNLKVEMDPAGGTSYIDMGSSPLISVPYALVANKALGMNIDDLNDVNTSGVVTNQVLQWNGTEWVPANVGGGGSDNWGSQTAAIDLTLTGNGTAGLPLGLASQGASNGQVLKWNGTTWLPSTITGDNWGSQTVTASSQFGGNGTSGNPLILAQQGATSGDVLQWSGISWIPGTINGISLPYAGTFNSATPVFSLTNSGAGTAVSGMSLSTVATAYGTEGYILSTGGGVNSAGVYGKNNTTNANGYGIKGEHAGDGAGVLGQSNGSNGIGVSGVGNIGVKGTTSLAAGKAIYGNATGGGHGGYFDGRVQVNANSTGSAPGLLINETEADFSRLRFTNTAPGQFWEFDAMNTGVAATEYFHLWNGINGPLLTVKGDGNTGIGNNNPTQRLDVVGNVKFSGALMPNNTAGTSGQVLISGGAGIAPTWGSSTNTLHNNTYLFDQSASLSLTGSEQLMAFNGATDLLFSVNTTSKIVIHLGIGNMSNGGGIGGDSYVRFKILIKDNLNNTVNYTYAYVTIPNNQWGTISYTHHCGISIPGTYKLNITGAVVGGDTDVAAQMGSPLQAAGQITLQVIPQ
jgi:hypothetical protein